VRHGHLPENNPSTRIATFTQQALPDSDVERRIRLQEVLGNSTFGRQGDDGRAFQPEVFGPNINPGVEQPDDPAGFDIDRSNITPLRAITIETRPHQIFFPCFPPMLDGDRMIDFMRKDRIVFVE
jgi:hypothetical protein